MLTNVLFVIISMLFVAGLPLVVKFVDNILNYVEKDATSDSIHKSAIG